jgi:Ca2+/Na+ antiporter
MSSSDRLLLILHIGFAIFTLGPLTAATMASPRYIRLRQVSVLRYLNRATRIYGLLALGIFLFGLLLADGDFSRAWLTASMTLFIVALALLFIVERDQRKAVHALELAAAGPPSAAPEQAAGPTPDKAAAEGAAAGQGEPAEGAPAGGTTAAQGPDARTTDVPAADAQAAPGEPAAASAPPIAQVEQGRIAAISGVIALIWLVILFLMVWYGRFGPAPLSG